MSFLGSIIGAGSSLLGGIFGKKSEKKARAQEYARQKEFATSSIQWRVQDAKKAGIHPLYALGASGVNYAPQQVGGTDYGISAAGQELGRAINATTGVRGRAQAFNNAMSKLQLKRMALENDLLASKIAVTNQQMQPAAPAGEHFVVDGQPASGLLDERAMRKTKGLPGYEHQEPAPISGVGYEKTPNGYAVVQSKDVKDRLEEDLPGSISWHIRNRVMPAFGKLTPPFPAPPMHKWKFNPATSEYILMPPKFRRKSNFRRNRRRQVR